MITATLHEHFWGNIYVILLCIDHFFLQNIWQTDFGHGFRKISVHHCRECWVVTRAVAAGLCGRLARVTVEEEAGRVRRVQPFSALYSRYNLQALKTTSPNSSTVFSTTGWEWSVENIFNHDAHLNRYSLWKALDIMSVLYEVLQRKPRPAYF